MSFVLSFGCLICSCMTEDAFLHCLRPLLHKVIMQMLSECVLKLLAGLLQLVVNAGVEGLLVLALLFCGKVSSLDLVVVLFLWVSFQCCFGFCGFALY